MRKRRRKNHNWNEMLVHQIDILKHRSRLTSNHESHINTDWFAALERKCRYIGFQTFRTDICISKLVNWRQLSDFEVDCAC